MRKIFCILLLGILLVVICGCENQQEKADCQEISGSLQEGNLTAVSCSSAENAELACLQALEQIEYFQSDNDLPDDYQIEVEFDIQSDITCKITAKW